MSDEHTDREAGGERELKFQPRPVCPHCGHEHSDAWEWNFGPGLDGESEGRQCYVCEGVFDCERVVDVSYTTRAAAAMSSPSGDREPPATGQP